jgi:peptide deformylase
MAIRQVLKMGDPLLFQRSQPVLEFHSEELNNLVADMFDTMAALDGAGLAAPQIGVLKRVVIFGLQSNPRYPEAESIPMTVLVNPSIEFVSSEMEPGWEGCLSVPGMRGKVDRYRFIRYTGFDQYGRAIEREAESFHARVVQHECDHLDGILYPLRISDMRDFGYEDVLFPELAEAD